MKKGFDLLNVTASGLAYGLRLNLGFSAPDNYDYRDVLIAIHNQSMPPLDIYNVGYLLSTGSWNYFQIERIFNTRLDPPYSDCLKDVTTFEKNTTIVKHILALNRTYTQTDCFTLCSYLSATDASNCSCNANLDQFFKKCVRKPFEIQTEEKACVAKYLSEFRKKEQYSKCPQYCPLECDSMSYTITPISKRIPTSGNVSIQRWDIYVLNNSATYEELSKSFVGILIYFKDLYYTQISQDAKSETFNFISNLGGILGLFLGVSFLSFIEVFEILFECFCVLLSK